MNLSAEGGNVVVAVPWVGLWYGQDIHGGTCEVDDGVLNVDGT
jgi:hypothetical protein